MTIENSNSAIPKITRNDEEAGSGDLARENIERLKALFPQIVADGKVDFDVLRQLLGDEVEEGEERYGLNWKGKRRARAFAMTPSLGTLRPAPEDSVEWDTTQNIMIEGDNLEVLKLLRRSYAGKVKLIYIDPPYNTGGDFVYPDDYKSPLNSYRKLVGEIGEEGQRLASNSETSGRFHSSWLNMIYPRILLSRELLREDGIFLTHCDEHEIENYTSVITDVFGPAAHLGTIIWDKRNPKGDAKKVSYQHEYLLLFSADPEALFRRAPLKRPKAGGAKIIEAAREFVSDSADIDEAREAFRGWIRRQNDLTGGEKMYNRLTDDGRVYRLVSMAWPNKKRAPDEYFIPLIHPLTKKECPVPERGWRNPPSTMEDLIENELIEFGPTHETQPQRIYFLDENMSENIPSIVGYAGSDDALLAELGIPFDQPKPVAFVRRLISWFSAEDDIIFDFFAGSGTVGQAVWEQNFADGASRRFLLTQLPEPLDPDVPEQEQAARVLSGLGHDLTIAELTKERLRRAGKKFDEEHPNAPTDTGFRVYKLSTSNLKPWQPDPDNLEASILDAVDNVLPGRGEDDLLVELLLKTGIDLTMPEEKREIAGHTVHALGGGALMVCLGNIADEQAEEMGQGMADWADELDPAQTTVYFKDSGIGSDGNRAATKANLAAILRQRLGDRIAKIASI